MNLYDTPEYQAYRSQEKAVFQKQHRIFPRERDPVTRLGPDLLVSSQFYEMQRNGWMIHASEHHLTDSCGKLLYTWQNLDNQGEFFYSFRHKNGKNYLLYREDLYGYSILELDTGNHFSYIPDCLYLKKKDEFQETFIWTEPFYDPESSFLAVSGCVWASPWSVIVLDFSEPLKEHGHEQWVDLHEIVDPHYHVFDDLEFFCWNKDESLTVFGYHSETGEKENLKFSREQLEELMNLKH